LYLSMQNCIIKLTTNRTICCGELTTKFVKDYSVKAFAGDSRFPIRGCFGSAGELSARAFSFGVEMKTKIKPVDKISQNLINKFWNKVDKSGDCWIFTDKSQKDDYGRVNIRKQIWLAHCFAWFLVKGFQSAHFLLHSCDNKKCVNPSHLREGTHADNAHDKVLRNRQSKGENHGRAKLHDCDIPEIDRLKYIVRMSEQEIASIYGVSRTVISHATLRYNWKHIPKTY
jgi:hypothetical protein